ncbi:MAG TPA: glutamyl-tRNA amidotransferase [Flavobacteriales bacterium]|nr:glutamyl-tRNA amidotransferase [Flavobacteriales bacterium]
MSNLAESISEGIKNAMRAKDRERLTALRDIKSKIMLEATKEGAGETVDDATTLAILSRLLKQRNETATLYSEQGREDLAAEELAQAAVIQEFLPAALSEAEIEAKVAEIITSIGASSMADMGKVMGLATSAMAGQADGKVISGLVRKALSSSL